MIPYWVILPLPFIVSLGLRLAIRHWILAFVSGALILPVMVLIAVAVWPPPPRTMWEITLVLSIVWGSITGTFGTLAGWTVLKVMEERRKPS